MDQNTTLLPPLEPEEIHEGPSPLPLMQLATSFWASKAFASAIDLNLFTELSERHPTLPQAQKLLGLQARPAEMLLTACVALGLLHLKDGEYSNSPLADKFLVKGRPNYFGEAVKMIDRRLYPAWGRLTQALKENKSQSWKDLEPEFEAVYADREEKRLFLECMHGMSVESGRQLARLFDFSNYHQLLDVGGGTGAYCIEILRRFPHLNAVVFDLPPALQITYEKIFAAGYSKLIKTYPGDFLTERLPEGADVMLISLVLHGLSPEKDRLILKKCFEALSPGGTLIVADSMMHDDKTGPVPSALMSLNMLIETEGGRNYSWQEYTDWMQEAGFENFWRLHMDSPGINGALIGEKPCKAPIPKKEKPPTEKKAAFLPDIEWKEEKDDLSSSPLMALATAFWPSKTFSSAIDLDLFTEMSGLSLTLPEVAKLLTLEPRPAEMLLTACVALGLLQIKDGEYSNSPLAEKFLVKGRPLFFGGVVKLFDRRLYPAWEKLTEALKTIQPQDHKVLENNFEVRYGDREERRLYLDCMHGMSIESGRKLANVVDFSKFHKLLDVGGGTGAYCIEILRRYPQLQAMIFDLPLALQIAYEKIYAAGYSKLIETYPGDFLNERLPRGADVILLSKILHGFNPEQDLLILKKCFEALPSGGAVILVDLMMNDDKTGPLDAALMSLNMLIDSPGGRSYSRKEYTDWMKEVGFEMIHHIQMESPGANGVLMGHKG